MAALQTVSADTFGLDTEGDVAPWTGLRPLMSDSRPIVGPSSVDGLFLNAGHGGLGWTLACGSARLLTDLIHGRAPSVSANLFLAARFQCRETKPNMLATPLHYETNPTSHSAFV